MMTWLPWAIAYFAAGAWIELQTYRYALLRGERNPRAIAAVFGTLWGLFLMSYIFLILIGIAATIAEQKAHRHRS